ncbi:MAG TPA: YfcE family phosphodiesterase [Oligoflexia bacterium]|nr:YfcE family phosphodiesterase [Oligoflexia bacterium]HMR23836.1 YfcE family phosphodiesterase [Oligoflexia bacterium]
MLVGFLSDAHGNINAFSQALELLKKYHVEKIFFLGDAVGYFDSPDIVNMIHQHKIIAVRGNHEQMLIDNQIPDNKEKYYRLKQHLNTSIIPTIKTWPTQLEFQLINKKIQIQHGSLNDPIYGYTYTDSDITPPKGIDLLVFGATHRPFTKQIDDTLVVNVGSCGFPRDQGHLGSFGIYDALSNSFTIERFDIRASLQHIAQTHQDLEQEITAVWKRNH